MERTAGEVRGGRLRNLFVLLVSLFLLGTVSMDASAKTVSDPNHKGYTGKYPRTKQVQWKPRKTKCEKCTKMMDQYNQTAQELLNHRYWLHFWREVHKSREKGKSDPFWPGKGDINEFESKAVGANLELFELQSAQLELHRKAVNALEKQLQYLGWAVNECERTACAKVKPSKFKGVAIGGVKGETPYQPDTGAILKQYGIDWKGPYSTKCKPCQKYVDQLNALPGWVVRAHMQLQRAETMLKYSEMIKKSNKIKVEHLKYMHPDKTDYSDLADKVAKLKQELASLKKLFDKLVKQLQECEKKFCPDAKDENVSLTPAGTLIPISTCPEPESHEAITVGANNDVGSSANFKEKAKKKAAGLATKAITGLLGIGGGGGGKSDGPETYKDPVKNKYKIKVKDKPEKREIRLGGVFTPDGLLISTDIKKAPGKGTFQTVYLENPRGWRLVPVRLFMYEIWADWKLSVSWTRDTYVDGQLVKHEEGGWTESWRELIASGREIQYAEVPIWEQLGFNTAVSGARSLGTLFEVSPEMLAQEPINLVIHVTDPKKDPVITFPYLFQVSLATDGKVVIEEVEETTVATSTVCTEGQTEPVIAGTTETPPDSVVDDLDGGPVDSVVDELDIPYCPDNWVCREGTTCPPVDNCTIAGIGTTPGVPAGTHIPTNPGTTTNTPSNTPSSTTNDGSTTQTPDDGIDELEEIEVTGTRISIDTKLEPPPVTTTTEQPDPADSTTEVTSEDTELEEVVVSGSYLKSTTRLRYGSMTLGADLRYNLEYPSIEEDPAKIYGEEIDEPEIVGIVLKNFDRHWVPRHNRYTFVTAKMYVPEAGSAARWVPHDSVKRKMKITFIARSNEKGKAMNADLDEGPQDSPDLYFDPGRNTGTECEDDPTSKGHYGTCTTASEHNEYTFAINSDDYGGFSRLDVSCDGCVPLTPVAGVYPEAFQRYQRWEVAVEERDQEKRAVYVPHDVNKNQISDGYLPEKTDSKSADDDSEDTPTGNGVAGDGLSAYEEYRGFINRWGYHERTDWDKKTLMIENLHQISTFQFENASGLEVVELEIDGHEDRIVNYNSGHANVVDQHGLILRMFPSLNDKYAGYCYCDRERPKGATRVTVKPAYRNTDTVAHELGHAIGMSHHGEEDWPEKETIRAMTSTWRDLLPGRVHSGPTLCGKTLPASFKVGTKGDQGSGNHRCIMKYGHYHYVYEQEGKDYDCMPSTPRSIFDDSSTGTGPNRMNRTAADASLGDCMSQVWINSK